MGDRQACIEWSLKVGYLTGEENEVCHILIRVLPETLKLNVFTVDARRTREVHERTRNTIQGEHSSAIHVRSRFRLGEDYR